MKRILIIQTAFIGDVILATAMVESLHQKYPDARIDFLLRKGNESLLKDHPNIHEVIIWDKQTNKYANLKNIISRLRKNPYDILFNLQRFGSSGWMTFRSKAKVKIGFKKNPFSFCYDHKAKHEIGKGQHEIERNFELLKFLHEMEIKGPRLYPSTKAFNKAKQFAANEEVVVMAPSSVWYTKQMPAKKWVELIGQYPISQKIALIGGAVDKSYLQEIIDATGQKNIINMAGELNLLESAALISIAKMTHVNDSAPLHLASAMNAPVRAYFCSTVPAFGFGPLSDQSENVEIKTPLECRPCGLHGKAQCPKGHFKCGNEIDVTLS